MTNNSSISVHFFRLTTTGGPRGSYPCPFVQKHKSAIFLGEVQNYLLLFN